MLLRNVGFVFKGSYLLKKRVGANLFFFVGLLSKVLIFLLFFYFFLIIVPKVTRCVYVSLGKRSSKNGTLIQLVSILDGSYWKNLLDYFDLKLDSFQIKRDKLDLSSNRVKWEDVLTWIYGNFVSIVTFSWFTAVYKEMRKWVTILRERFRLFFQQVENKNYFENLSNLRALIAVQSVNLLLIT